MSTGPTVHGVYDYFLGGAEHLRADRDLGKAIEERFPSVPAHVRAAREFHLRAARWCAERDVIRFICTGVSAWKPGVPNVDHAAPGAEAVYVHRGADAHERARAVLPSPRLRSVRGRVNFPGEVLSSEPAAEMLAAGEPVCLMLGMTLHFAAAEEAAQQVAQYAGALPPGSVLAASVALADSSPRAGELLAMFTPATVYRHTADGVAGWLTGAGLAVVPPGVCDVRALLGGVWAPGGPRAPGMTAGALAVKP